ncbi:hypothetical protein P9112_012602 [Eukaryota sp. TZLM1-RC]
MSFFVPNSYNSTCRMDNWHEDYLKNLPQPKTSCSTTMPSSPTTSTVTCAHRVIKSNDGTFDQIRHLTGDLSDVAPNSRSLNDSVSANHKLPRPGSDSFHTNIQFEDEGCCSTYKDSFNPSQCISGVQFQPILSSCRGEMLKTFDKEFLKLGLRE